MEDLFSRLYNLRAVKVGCTLVGWILNALRALHRKTNNNIVIEDIHMRLFGSGEVFSVPEIAEYCPQLQSLSVTFNISEDSLIALSRHCPLLKKLKFFRIPRISTEQNAALCAPTLSCLHSILTSVDDIDIYSCAQKRTQGFLPLSVYKSCL